MKATVQHPDGSTTKASLDLGVFRGCATVWWGAVALYVLTFPATYFSTGWAVFTYVGYAAVLALYGYARTRQ